MFHALIIRTLASQDMTAGYSFDELRAWRQIPISGKLFLLYDEAVFRSPRYGNSIALVRWLTANGFAGDGWDPSSGPGK